MTPHEQLIEIYNLSEFGVKTRVFETYSQQSIDYIRKHPDYKDKEKIKDIIDCFKTKSKEVMSEISEMHKQIQGM